MRRSRLAAESLLLLRLGVDGYSSTQNIIDERLEAFARAPALLEVEKVMRSAMVFRASRPWMVANPAARMEWLEELLAKFRVPSVVINGAIGHFGNAPIEGAEMMYELHCQALASQLLRPVATDASGEGYLQCGFGLYKIERGCPYQESHSCSARVSSYIEPPVHPKFEDNDEVTGCSFAFVLEQMTGGIKAIRLVPAARFPATWPNGCSARAHNPLHD